LFFCFFISFDVQKCKTSRILVKFVRIFQLSAVRSFGT
jgi:hypothetical protein